METQEKKNPDFHSEKRTLKKDHVLGRSKPIRSRIVLVSLTVFLLITCTFFYIVLTHRAEQPASSSVPITFEAPSDTASYPLSLFEDGKARHFSHRTVDGITVKYFVLKSSDGVIRAAFDACDVCWPAGRGYAQAGDSMVCRNCGRQFASVLVNEVKGGCNPAPLTRTVTDGKVTIAMNDLEAGKTYFDFSTEVGQ